MSTPLLVDDNDPSVHYSENWALDAGFAPAFAHTRHGAASEGLNISFTFEGTGVEVVIALDPTPQGGRPTVSYTIDGEHVATLTVPLSDAKLTQFNVTAFSKTDLPMGSHVLGLTNVNGTSPNLFWIDYFRVYDSSPSTQQQSSTVVTSAIIPASSVPQAIPTGNVSYLSETTPSLSISYLPSLTVPGHTSSPNTEPESSTVPPMSPLSTIFLPSATPEAQSSSSSVPNVLTTTSSVPSSTVYISAASQETSHTNIPAMVGGVFCGIVVASAMVGLVLFMRRRNKARRAVVDTCNTASYFSNEGWIALRSNYSMSEQDVTADAAHRASVLGDGRSLDILSQYTSAVDRSDGESASIGIGRAL